MEKLTLQVIHMIFYYVIGLVTAIGLAVYLFVALLKPELFS